MKIDVATLNLNSYGYVIAIANINDKHDRSTPSHYHWKILKCRMIIFSNSSILASPDKKDLQQVHILFKRAGDDYDKLNSLFMKFSLAQDGAIQATTPEIFQMCFHYTMIARLAPVWNTLGDKYLINNRDFLVTKGPQEGINYSVAIDDKSILNLDIKTVKINMLNSEEVFLPGEWIRVLPSMNKAVIEEHYESLPLTSRFRYYKDLRRHWKNIHGYRLPEEESSYYSIQFWRGEPLLYPKICVIRNFPIIVPTNQIQEKSILRAFINSFNVKMSSIFGTVLSVPDFEGGNVTSFVPNSHLMAETQPVSLCTPTQSKHFTGNH